MRTFLVSALFAAVVLVASLALATDYPYPYPYQGPKRSTSVNFRWQLGDTSKVFNFDMPLPDIRNGELINSTLTWQIPYNPVFQGTLADGIRAQVHDDWTLTLESEGIVGGAFYGEVQSYCPAVCAPGQPFSFTPLNLAPLTNDIFYQGPTFDRTNVTAYNPRGVAWPDQADTAPGNFTLVSSVEQLPSVTSYRHNTTLQPIVISHNFRQWTSEDLLAGRMVATTGQNFMGIYLNRVVAENFTGDPGPANFGFSVQETAHASDFDNFNYQQNFKAFYESVDGAPFLYFRDDAKFETLTQGAASVGGVDPSVQNPNPILNPAADAFAPYWDQIPIAGRETFNVNHPKQLLGTRFEDQPNLLKTGRMLFFETTMGGWSQSDTTFSNFTDPMFTWRWAWKQVRDDAGCRQRGDCGVATIQTQTAVDPGLYNGVAIRFGTGAWTPAAIDEAVQVLAALEFPPGDYNLDGRVDAADFTVWADTVGSTTNFSADGNLDGSIDELDYAVWEANFGVSLGAAALLSGAQSVPEPSGAALLLVISAMSRCKNMRRPAA